MCMPYPSLSLNRAASVFPSKCTHTYIWILFCVYVYTVMKTSFNGAISYSFRRITPQISHFFGMGREGSLYRVEVPLINTVTVVSLAPLFDPLPPPLVNGLMWQRASKKLNPVARKVRQLVNSPQILISLELRLTFPSYGVGLIVVM